MAIPSNSVGEVSLDEPEKDVRKPYEDENEGDGDFDGHGMTLTRSTYIFAMCAAINSCNLGYDIGVNTNAGPLIESSLELQKWQRELFIGSLNFWSMFGSLCAPYISDKYGRRRSFIAAAVTFIFGIVIMASAQAYFTLMFGRVFVGLGIGFGLAIDPIYIAEISPASRRGELVTWSEIMINVGIVSGFASGLVFYGLDEDTEWRVLFLMGAILPVVMIFLVLTVMPESPRWLVAKGRSAEAKRILQQIYPVGFDIEPVVQDIADNLEKEREANNSVGWSAIFFPSPAIKRMLLVGVLTAVAQQANGIDAIQNYLIDVLEIAGLEKGRPQLYVLIALGIVKLAFILVGGKLFDTRGRKPLLLWSLAGMIFALLLVSSTFLGGVSETGAAIAVLGLAAYMAFYSIGMGPGAWLVPSEVFSTTVRAKAMSVATFCNRLTATLMSSTFLSTADAMGWAGFFFLLAVICVIIALFFIFYLPETKGKSLEDMLMYFAEITGDQSVIDAEERVLERRRSSQEDTSESGKYSGQHSSSSVASTSSEEHSEDDTALIAQSTQEMVNYGTKLV